MTTDNLCFYYQNRLIKTIQTGGHPPLVFPGPGVRFTTNHFLCSLRMGKIRLSVSRWQDYPAKCNLKLLVHCAHLFATRKNILLAWSLEQGMSLKALCSRKLQCLLLWFRHFNSRESTLSCLWWSVHTWGMYLKGALLEAASVTQKLCNDAEKNFATNLVPQRFPPSTGRPCWALDRPYCSCPFPWGCSRRNFSNLKRVSLKSKGGSPLTVPTSASVYFLWPAVMGKCAQHFHFY
jgi:hypothetical protein